ncbi:MAG TPA: TRAP transporter small permease [Firmicutes bacterium]|nr:TRAP transporter small permease [Bacillota bacterium]
MSGLQRFSTGLNNIMRGFTILIVVAMFIVVVMQVFCRYVLNYSFFWSDELVRYLFIWMAFFGGSVAFKGREHLTIDLLVRQRGTRLGKVLAFIKDMMILLVFVTVIYHGVKLCITNIPKESITLGISMSIPYLAIPGGILVMLVHHLAHMELTFRFYVVEQGAPSSASEPAETLIN